MLIACCGSAVAQGYTLSNGGRTVKLWGTGYNMSSSDLTAGTSGVEDYWKLVAFPTDYIYDPSTNIPQSLYMPSGLPSLWNKSAASCGTPCLNTPVTVDGDTYRWVTYAKYPNTALGLSPASSDYATSYFRSSQPTSGTPTSGTPVINPAQNYNYIIQAKNKFIPTVAGN
jgi:hypothetical protein